MPTGRPKIEWSDREYRQIESLCGLLCTQVDICSVMGVCEETLNRLIFDRYGLSFSEFYKKYSATGRVSLRRYQMEAAKKGNPTVLIWLGKQMLGQSDSGPRTGGDDSDDSLLTALEDTAREVWEDGETGDVPV